MSPTEADSDAPIADTLRDVAHSVADSQALRRSLLWVAGEVQTLEETVREAASEVSSLRRRVTAAEVRSEHTAGGAPPPVDVRAEIDRYVTEVLGSPDLPQLLASAGGGSPESDAMSAALSQLATKFEAAEARELEQERVLARLEAFAERIYERVEASDTAKQAMEQAAANEVSELRDELHRMTSEIAASQETAVSGVSVRLGVNEERLAGAEERLVGTEDRLDANSQRLAATDERIDSLLGLNSDVQGVYQELDRIAELTVSRDSTIAQLEDRLAPLETAFDGVHSRLEEISASTLPAHEKALAQLEGHVTEMADRIDPVDLLAERVADLGREIVKAGGQASRAQEAALAATTEQIGMDGRLRMLEGLPADIEGVYRDFERVMEATTARDERQGDALDRQADVDAAFEALRGDLERVSSEGQTAELDLRRRLATLESLTGDLESLYRELGRMTTMANEHEDRSAGMEASVTSLRDGVSELRGRIDDERVHATEQLSGLWARLRDMEAIPQEVERVSTDLGELTEAVRGAFGDSSETLDGVDRRVAALEKLPSDIQTVSLEVARLAQAAREQDEKVTDMQSDLQPLATALAGVRGEIERLRLADSKLSGFDERLAKVDELPSTVAKALRDLNGRSDELRANNQASLARSTVLLEEFHDRLRALEGLPADMEGLYAALYRVAESVKELREGAPT